MRICGRCLEEISRGSPEFGRRSASGVRWIRYRVDGRLKREKVGRKGDAIALYQLRKSQTRAGKKLPANLRNAGVRFSELADAILTYSASHHRDTRNIKSRIKKILPEFGERVAEGIKPEEIDSWLTTHTSTATTANRYRALFSLVFREALRNGKVNSNPARLVRQRHEDNARIRWLEEDEEERLRAVINGMLAERDLGRNIRSSRIARPTTQNSRGSTAAE